MPRQPRDFSVPQVVVEVVAQAVLTFVVALLCYIEHIAEDIVERIGHIVVGNIGDIAGTAADTQQSVVESIHTIATFADIAVVEESLLVDLGLALELELELEPVPQPVRFRLLLVGRLTQEHLEYR